jgi:hypothetical protein
MRRHLPFKRIAEIIREHPSTAAELTEAEKSTLLSIGDKNITLYTASQQLGMSVKSAEIFLNERASTVEAIAHKKGYVGLRELGESHIDVHREMERIKEETEAAQNRGIAKTEGMEIVAKYTEDGRGNIKLKKTESCDDVPRILTDGRSNTKRGASGGGAETGTDGDDDGEIG